jgi:hypothetical protein
MAYCKYSDTLFIYGGIACSSSLQDGIKQYFYKLSEGKWSEVKPSSTYNTLHLAMDTLLHHTIEMSFYLEEYHNTNKSLKIVVFILIVQPILQSKIIGGWSKLVDRATKQGKIMLQQFTINSISFQGD